MKYLFIILMSLSCSHQDQYNFRIPNNVGEDCTTLVSNFIKVSDAVAHEKPNHLDPLLPAEINALKVWRDIPFGFNNLLKDKSTNEYYSGMLATITNHPRVSNQPTRTYFQKGGPFKGGPNNKDLKLRLKHIFELPEQEIQQALRSLLKELNTGDAGIDKALKDAGNNIKVSLSNNKGFKENMIFLGYIHQTGEVRLSRMADPNHAEYVITGASFYERLTEKDLALFKFPPPPLPESEWFKVIKSKPTGHGKIYTSELKASPPTEDDIQILDNRAFDHHIQLVANAMNVNTMRPILDDFIMMFPELAKKFNIKVLNDNAKILYEHPDVELLNSTMETLEYSPTIRFVTDRRFLSVPTLKFARTWADEGKLTVMTQGSGFFHDTILHLLGYVALPNEIVAENRETLKFILKVLDHPDLTKSELIRKSADEFLENWMQNFDNQTGRFIGNMARVGPEKRDEAILDFIRSLQANNASSLKEKLVKEVEGRVTEKNLEIIKSMKVPGPKVIDSQILLQQVRAQLYLRD